RCVTLSFAGPILGPVRITGAVGVLSAVLVRRRRRRVRGGEAGRFRAPEAARCGDGDGEPVVPLVRAPESDGIVRSGDLLVLDRPGAAAVVLLRGPVDARLLGGRLLARGRFAARRVLRRVVVGRFVGRQRVARSRRLIRVAALVRGFLRRRVFGGGVLGAAAGALVVGLRGRRLRGRRRVRGRAGRVLRVGPAGGEEHGGRDREGDGAGQAPG